MAEEIQKHMYIQHKMSFLRKLFHISPMIDLGGYMTDHRLIYKEHWIESCRTNPERLKSSLAVQSELELILAILYVSVTMAIFSTAVLTDATFAEDFTSGELSLASICIFVGILAIISGITFVMSSFMNITLLQTISAENTYAFCKSHARLIHVPSLVLIINFYASLAFICLFVIKGTGGSWRSHVVVWGILGVFLIPLYAMYVLAFNVSMKSGLFSSTQVISTEKALNLTKEEIDNILVNRAMQKEELSRDAVKFYTQIEQEGIAEDKSSTITRTKGSVDSHDRGRTGLLSDGNKRRQSVAIAVGH